MKKPAFDHPASLIVPGRAADAPAPGTPAQQAFRQAIEQVEGLRERLRALRAEQAEARRRYWQQVGPAAGAVVAARRALYPPLEEALLLGYFSRLEERRIVELIVANARALEERFGEDEAVIIRKYASAQRPGAASATEVASSKAGFNDGSATSAQPESNPDPTLPPHEQAAQAARARRLTKAQRATQAAAQASPQQLETNTKTLYRQLARTHHPDLERDPDKQAARTAQMQRITAAYEADDLYTLLQLLSESGPADAASVEVLTRYTEALRQQQVSLKNELNELKYGPQGFAGSTGKKRELELRQLRRELRAEADYVAAIGRRLPEPEELRELLRELSAAGLAGI